MSMPTIPDLNPDITLNREDAGLIILSSIGMEELALSHLLNAEAEKVQYVLGTLNTSPFDKGNTITVNRSAEQQLKKRVSG